MSRALSSSARSVSDMDKEPDGERGVPPLHGSQWADLPWLLRQRVLLPDRVAGYMRRPVLEDRCQLLDYGLVTLVAPGGFGKTALLVERCWRLRESGTTVAWLSLDEEDGPDTLVTYLALAFEQAGLAAFERREGDDDIGSGDGSNSKAEYQVNLLIGTIERHGRPCLLALDELERLTQPDAIAALNLLLQRAPPNLHFAIAYRELPPGLDIAMFILEGRGTTVTVEDLRFSKGEVAAFFDTWLSRHELDEIAERSAGWPLALRIYRNARQQGAREDVGGDAVAAWIETRLWRGLSREDRDVVLDMALFDWFDAELMDEATGTPGAARRVESIRSLTGLLQRNREEPPKMRLHPLIQEYCAARQSREAPDRFRTVHAQIARALARRGQVDDALRHAVMANDPRLAGEVAEDAGGIRLALRAGFEVLRKVVGMLKAETFDMYPRVAIGRCLVLAITADLPRAERLYRSIAAATSDFTRDREGGDDRALVVDHLLLQGMLFSTGCRLRGMKELGQAARAAEVAAGSDLDPAARGMFSFGFGLVQSHVAEFDGAVECMERARTQIGPRSHLAPHVYYELGSIAMAQGSPTAAAAYYDQALVLAKGDYLRDSGAVLVGGILRGELAVESMGFTPKVKPVNVSPRLLGESGATFQVYTASLGVAAELAIWNGTADRALALVEDAREYALRTNRPSFAKFLSAVYVSLLLAEQRVDDAIRAWEVGELPVAPDDCANLDKRGWRRTEMLACTRMRLCGAQKDFEGCRELFHALREVAASRGIKRTLMRAEALSMALEFRAGNRDAANQHLDGFLSMYAESAYAFGLLRERRIALELLDERSEAMESGSMARLAELVRRALAERESGDQPSLTDGEMDVLWRIARHQRDKQIATDLALSVDGVRYRIRQIFAKLNARGRFDAVHRARRLGVLPEEGAPQSKPT
ncbi:MAG: hypothetical protein F4X98_10875 [Gammaproteobacteria bacterium]|nr:hypothetical protein [Gammaproteobacteria bacterium]